MKKQILTLALATYGFMVVDAATQRAYSAGNFSLTLDGVQAGFLNSTEGGAITADVIESPLAEGQSAEKHLGQPRYESFSAQFGLTGMDGSVYQWISQSWDRNYIRKNGSVIASDFRQNARTQREFFNAVITETTIPACDGASKDPGYLKIKFAPEYTRSGKPTGKAVGNAGADAKKAWLPGNFRLKIDGLDCTRIVRIESFTVKQTNKQDEVGETRDYLKEPGKIDYPNLRISLSAVSAQTWQDWFQDFVVAGNNASGSEKHGTLELLSPNRSEVLATIEFTGLGIFRLDASQDAGDAPDRITADLYVEKMAFTPGQAIR